MKKRNMGRWLIINAMVWAAAILWVSRIADGGIHGPHRDLMMLLITGWSTAQVMIIMAGRSPRKEWACLRRRFGGGNGA